MTDGAEETNENQPGRRPILKGMAGLAALAVGGVAARLVAGEDGPGGGEVLSLMTHGSDVGSLEVPVDDDIVRSVGSRRWRSGEIETSSFSMVAFVWAVGSTSEVRIRVRRKNSWSDWFALPPVHETPDPDVDAATHTGTELVWVGVSDGIQFEITGSVAPNTKMVLLYPRRRGTDAPELLAMAPIERASSRTAEADALRPPILMRPDWGADERWRDGAPTYNHAMRQVHVHHTVSGNDYSRADVPGLIRGMYRYHTHNLGWSDIAYNFLVDRFGRVWEGRAGGVHRRVRGAHTLGFNTTSTGVAVIGNFEVARPSEAVLDGLASIAAWKIHRFGGNPRGTTEVRSEGSDKFGPGDLVRLPVIDGHRDSNYTACPGEHLYAALPTIRRRAAALIEAAEGGNSPVVIKQPASLSGAAMVGSTLSVVPGTYEPSQVDLTYAWLRDGVEVPGRSEATYPCTAADFGARISVRVKISAVGRLPVSETLDARQDVIARPTLDATVVGGTRRARVRIRVAPPGGITTVPTGKVVAVLGDREKVADLAEGVVTIPFFRVRPGATTITVRYLGGDGFRAIAGEVTGTVADGVPGW